MVRRRDRAALLLLVTTLPYLDPMPAIAAQDRADTASAAIRRVPAHGASPASPTGEIVVTATRRGEALVTAETELTEHDISIYNADSVQQLLERIAPEIGGSAALPEVVINGERVDPAMIKAFPPEVLARLAILKPEAAARYGFEPGKRVVNLVLKEHFESWNGEASVSMATRGGRWGKRLNAGRFLVAGDLRWNVQASASRDSRLLKSDRDLPAEPEDEWAVAAGVNPQRYETLLPSSTSLSLNSGITHPIGDFSGTLSLNAAAISGESLLGLARSGSGSVPDADVKPEPLRSTNFTRTLTLRAGMSGHLAGWHMNTSVNVTQSWTESRFDRASFDIAAGKLTEQSDGFSRTISGQVDARKDILALPAGSAGLAIDLRGDTSRSTTARFSDDGSAEDFDAARQRVSARASLSLPIASRALDVLQPLGDLSVDLGVNAEKAANAPLRWRWNAGGTWSPVEPFRLRASYEYEQRMPTFEQLNAPLLETVNRVFDFTRQEVAEVVWITGGNPVLREGSARHLSIDAMLRPLGDQVLTFNLNYRRDRQVGGIAGLPALTPTVEAAFPDRFSRDADGRLIAIDARPINIESESSAQLTSGMTVRWSGSGDRPIRLSATLSHRWRLEDTIVTGRGIAPIDRLDQGAVPRHSATMQIVAARSGLGLTLNGNWTGEARVAGDAGYRYAPTLLFDLEVYAEPERLWGSEAGWAQDLKLALDLQNVLAGYRRVTTSDGTPAPGFERDLIDPLGRTIRLTVTKRF